MTHNLHQRATALEPRRAGRITHRLAFALATVTAAGVGLAAPAAAQDVPPQPPAPSPMFAWAPGFAGCTHWYLSHEERWEFSCSWEVYDAEFDEYWWNQETTTGTTRPRTANCTDTSPAAAGGISTATSATTATCEQRRADRDPRSRPTLFTGAGRTTGAALGNDGAGADSDRAGRPHGLGSMLRRSRGPPNGDGRHCRGHPLAASGKRGRQRPTPHRLDGLRDLPNSRG